MAQNIPLPSLQCPAPVLHAGKQGIARVAVDDGAAQLLVGYLSPVTQSYLLNPLSYSLTGGERIFPRVVSAASDPQGVRLQLDQAGDFSIYTLTVNGPDIDPFFGARKLRFRLACDDRFDCRPPTTLPVPADEIPIAVDYLTKDYAGFRQALLDFLPTRMPSWTERSEADLGMALVELFAHTADNLSYIQDRVASEAYLNTATQRRSVAGHLALIGYQMDEGASAQTWLQFQVNAKQAIGGQRGFKVSNAPEGAQDPVIVFETMGELTLDPVHNRMLLYDFGNVGCCLPPSALSAALLGHFDKLNAGDFLLFDDGAGGCDVVRLVSQPRIVDVYTLVEWSAQTPLSRTYCAAGSVVRGNLISATHGETVSEQLTGFRGVRRQRVPLANGPLAHLDPDTPGLDRDEAPTSASAFANRIPKGISTLSLSVNGTPWTQLPTLLGTKPSDNVYRVEIDDDGYVTLVFGDGSFGARVPDKAMVIATYRAGGGARGNVGAGTLTNAHPDDPATWLVSVTNPLPATGGRDLESRDHARRVAPATFQTPLVAVTASDYEAAAIGYRDASGRPAIQRANASFRWTGSWLTVTLAVDPLGRVGLQSSLRQGLLASLNAKRLAGYDVEIVSPVYVPIEVEIQFSAKPGSQPADVEQAILQALGPEGFFNPDNFTFGDHVAVSGLYAAVMAVAGVSNARITGLARLHASRPANETAANLAQGFLAIGRDQIVRLDNDRNFPQHGTLSIRALGGSS